LIKITPGNDSQGNEHDNGRAFPEIFNGELFKSHKSQRESKSVRVIDLPQINNDCRFKKPHCNTKNDKINDFYSHGSNRCVHEVFCIIAQEKVDDI
jgi:hypothetical protein